MDQFPASLLLLVGLAVGVLIGCVLMWIRNRLVMHSAIRDATRRSIQQSRSTLKGQISEQLAPLLPGFPYHAADARFLGDPIDYVIFNGYTEVKDDSGDPDQIEIIILDVKTDGATLSRTQRAIKAAVESGRVRFEVMRVQSTSRARRIRAHRTMS